MSKRYITVNFSEQEFVNGALQNNSNNGNDFSNKQVQLIHKSRSSSWIHSP